MTRLDDRSAYRPLMFGGVEFLSPSTGLFRDIIVRKMLSSDQRFEAYLQFREEAFKIAARELVAAFNSPVDLFLFTDEDGQQFRSDYLFHYVSFRDPIQDSINVGDQTNESEASNNSPATVLSSGDQSNEIHDYKNSKELLLKSLHYTQRYFVYRKGLVKLDFSQFNNDPGKALEWLKSSTGWSQLHEDELKRGLKSHMDFLKENVPKSVALERINAELASELEKKLETSDWALMGHYYNRMKLRNLARVCSIEAQAAGVILVQQALPPRKISKEQIVASSPDVLKFPFMKQTVRQSLEGWRAPLGRIHAKFGRGGEKFRNGVSRRLALLSLIPETIGTVGSVSSR